MLADEHRDVERPGRLQAGRYAGRPEALRELGRLELGDVVGLSTQRDVKNRSLT